MVADTRTPIRQLVDAVLEWSGNADIDGSQAKTRRRGPDIRAEARGRATSSPERSLWIAVVEDAVTCAEQIAKRGLLPGETQATGNFIPARRERAKQAENLLDWCSGNHIGSLDWISDKLGFEDGTTERIRLRVLRLLDGSAQPRNYRRDKSRSMAGQFRVVERRRRAA